MGFDIRFPIGMLFSLFGILLTGYGVATKGSAIYAQHSLGLNINLMWGVVLLLFGLTMLLLTRLRKLTNSKGQNE
jgi:hypothetical protein